MAKCERKKSGRQRYYFLIAVILQIFVSGAVFENTSDTNPYEQLDWDMKGEFTSRENFFSSFGPHKMPMYFCDVGTQGNRYFLPEVPSCQYNRKYDNKPQTIHNVTFWMRDSNLFNVKGIHCFAYKILKTVFYHGLLATTYTEKLEKSQVQVGFEDCQRMIHEKMTPEGLEMIFKSDGYFSCEKNLSYSYGWPSTHYVEWVDYHTEQYNVGIDPVSFKISTLAPTVKDCYVTDANCKTTQGYLMWKETDYKKCNLMKSKTAVCVLSDGVMTCPARNMLMTGLRVETVCGKTIATADQLLLLSPDDVSWDVRLHPTSEFNALVNIRNPRETISSQPMLNSQLQYIQNVFLKNMDSVNERICAMQQVSIRNARADAEDGRPDKLAQAFFGRGVRAEMEGQVIFVRTCQKIEYYRFLPQISNCTKEWPLVFKFSSDGKVRKGFLGNSYEITSDFQEIDCPPPTFYFKVGNDAYLLNEMDGSAIRRMEALIPPGDGAISKDWQKATFREAGDLDLQDVGCGSCFREMTMNINRHNRILSSLENAHGNESAMAPAVQSLFQVIEQKMNSRTIMVVFLTAGLLVLLIPILCCLVYCKCIERCGVCVGEAMDQLVTVTVEKKDDGRQNEDEKRCDDKKIEITSNVIFQDIRTAHLTTTSQPAAFNPLTSAPTPVSVYPSIVDVSTSALPPQAPLYPSIVDVYGENCKHDF